MGKRPIGKLDWSGRSRDAGHGRWLFADSHNEC